MVKTSMPHAPNGIVYWKQNTYDGLGSTVSAEADGYAYLGNTVQVTDPLGCFQIDPLAPSNPSHKRRAFRFAAEECGASAHHPEPTPMHNLLPLSELPQTKKRSQLPALPPFPAQVAKYLQLGQVGIATGGRILWLVPRRGGVS
jgi:hypothetical protein